MYKFRSARCVATLVWISAIVGGALNSEASGARPRLIVVLSIDQLRGDYITRFDDCFGEDGFRRIEREGFTYRNCLYPTANTETGPGHACLLSGAYAHRNGITQNNWYDAAEGREVYCVGDEHASPVTGDGASAAPAESASPRRLLAGTAGDSLETTTSGAAKTVSISLKDRAAILMGGHAADIALWFDRSTGRFVTSSYYTEALPAWVMDFNAAKPADAWFKTEWALSVAPEEYSERCTVDAYPAEAPENGRFSDASFPHTLGAASDAPDEGYYAGLCTSPFSNDLLVQLAQVAVEHEGMGRDDIPDLLTIGFSCNDLIGHAFGPDSWEVMDATIKTDASVATLLRYLDSVVGAGAWTLFVTADHGVASFPEVLRERRIDAQRVSASTLAEQLDASLKETFGAPHGGTSYIAGLDVPWVSFVDAAFDPASPGRRDAVVAAAVAWLRGQASISGAWPLRDVEASTDALLLSVQRSYFPGRAGDVALTYKAGYLQSEKSVGTGHGTAYTYDQYVPLLALGAGIRRGETARIASPAEIAPTVALLAGTVPPDRCEVAPMTEALGHD